ncbi:hypothetical protein Q75_13070 [Bacillus coahuilensis p1.1.43]|uniref:Uncharacterized protein n=1 Tax=Bacillus coahuilensis p1.1.43 TaxID=1150625 RepID=A0A147K5U4_9BACI|nr:hypothetical protein [Bacillus coahuilensis]KUP05184.1 hypothetical protein Q75_13070 [Bacillus coahuilensis p1.1.43]
MEKKQLVEARELLEGVMDFDSKGRVDLEDLLRSGVILAAILTELAAADLLSAEAAKVRAFVENYTGTPTTEQVLEANRTVASVAQSICCIKQSVVAELGLAFGDDAANS